MSLAITDILSTPFLPRTQLLVSYPPFTIWTRWFSTGLQIQNATVMNLTLIFTGAVAATLLSNCVHYHSKLDNSSNSPPSGWHLSRVIDHEKDSWNTAGVWRRVSSTPPSFVPTDFPRQTSPAGHGGQWVVDENDGWRFFVPTGGTRRYSEGMLLGEAHKVTNDMPASSHRKQNVLTSVFVWPVLSILAMPATLMGCLGSDPSDQ